MRGPYPDRRVRGPRIPDGILQRGAPDAAGAVGAGSAHRCSGRGFTGSVFFLPEEEHSSQPKSQQIHRCGDEMSLWAGDLQ